MNLFLLQGTVVIVRTTTADALTGAVVALNEFSIFALGAGLSQLVDMSFCLLWISSHLRRFLNCFLPDLDASFNIGIGAYVGGFGTPWPSFPRPASAVRDATPPNRAPDFETCATTTPDQVQNAFG